MKYFPLHLHLNKLWTFQMQLNDRFLEALEFAFHDCLFRSEWILCYSFNAPSCCTNWVSWVGYRWRIWHGQCQMYMWVMWDLGLRSFWIFWIFFLVLTGLLGLNKASTQILKRECPVEDFLPSKPQHYIFFKQFLMLVMSRLGIDYRTHINKGRAFYSKIFYLALRLSLTVVYEIKSTKPRLWYEMRSLWQGKFYI